MPGGLWSRRGGIPRGPGTRTRRPSPPPPPFPLRPGPSPPPPWDCPIEVARRRVFVLQMMEFPRWDLIPGVTRPPPPWPLAPLRAVGPLGGIRRTLGGMVIQALLDYIFWGGGEVTGSTPSQGSPMVCPVADFCASSQSISVGGRNLGRIPSQYLCLYLNSPVPGVYLCRKTPPAYYPPFLKGMRFRESPGNGNDRPASAPSVPRPSPRPDPSAPPPPVPRGRALPVLPFGAFLAEEPPGKVRDPGGHKGHRGSCWLTPSTFLLLSSSSYSPQI